MTNTAMPTGQAHDAPLSDLTILDFSRYFPAQLCTWILADFGANVIRVENPRELRKIDAAFNLTGLSKSERAQKKASETFERNKRSIVVDLGHDKAKDILYPLAAQADVVIEDYRPGVLGRLGLGFEDLHRVNSRLNYCSVTYAGQTGPYRNRAGHDQLALALSGILSRTGENPQRPAFPNVPIADVVTGLSAAIGIMTAHNATRKSGIGQVVDISILDSTMPFIAWFLSRYPDPAMAPARGSHRVDYGIWQTRDGKFICTSNVEPVFWKRFCEVIGREDFIALQRNASEWDNMRAAIGSIMLTRTCAEWMEIFESHEIQAAPVNDFHEALSDPQFRERGMALEAPYGNTSVLQVGNPITLSKTPAKVTRLGEIPGNSSAAILAEFGFTAAQIEAFLAAGAIVNDQA